jgi:hypothetical protein
MAHFAKLDEDNNVIQVIVIDNEKLMKDGKEDKETGIAFCKKLFGEDTNWAQTSYNSDNYAGIGDTYDPVKKGFIKSKSYDSWILDEDCNWKAPTEKSEIPDNWDEKNKEWVNGK